MGVQILKKNIEKYFNEECKHIVDVCPHCGGKAQMDMEASDFYTFKNGDIEYYAIFRCIGCHRISLKILSCFSDAYYTNTHYYCQWRDGYPQQTTWNIDVKNKEYIPENVFNDFVEGIKCKNFGAYKASCAMFRRALQSALLELGCNKNDSLKKQIASIDKLNDTLKEWATEIRFLGNWGAHPDDEVDDVNEEIADETYNFISKLLEYVFVMPKKIEQSRNKRNK